MKAPVKMSVIIIIIIISGNSLNGGSIDSNWVAVGVSFSTYDRENNPFLPPGDCCACMDMSNGWWFRYCQAANLNGQYDSAMYGGGIQWYAWTNFGNSLKASQMKVIPFP